jgi:hypothetical protein
MLRLEVELVEEELLLKNGGQYQISPSKGFIPKLPSDSKDAASRWLSIVLEVLGSYANTVGARSL